MKTFRKLLCRSYYFRLLALLGLMSFTFLCVVMGARLWANNFNIKKQFLTDNGYGANSDTINDVNKLSSGKNKIILYYGSWYGLDWKDRFFDQDDLQSSGCPFYNCKFTYDRKFMHTADAILFTPMKTYEAGMLPRFNFLQRWIYVDIEVPHFSTYHPYHYIIDAASERFIFNWSMTYHSNADIVVSYGHFIPIVQNYSRPIRSHLMDYESLTMQTYLKDLDNPVFIKSQFQVKRNYLAAWMSSHCVTTSKREILIKELQKLIKIDTFGTCGTNTCVWHAFPQDKCWRTVLAPNYLFYFALENSLCEEYLTEKVYYPLHYGIVPIVYGHVNYSQFLPPNSYIDAREHSPQSLANLLTDLQNDTLAYSRYHLWRKYWKVSLKSSSCEICYQLNVNHRIKNYKNIPDKRMKTEVCLEPTFTTS